MHEPQRDAPLVFREVADSADFLGHLSVRWHVFVVEQRVPFVLEVDARDFADSTSHIVAALPDGQVVGAARLLRDSSTQSAQTHFHVGRVAVLPQWRGRGVGAHLMRKAADVACGLVDGFSDVVLELDAQVQALGFYEQLGYKPTVRKPFLDAGILHQEMQKTLPATGTPTAESR